MKQIDYPAKPIGSLVYSKSRNKYGTVIETKWIHKKGWGHTVLFVDNKPFSYIHTKDLKLVTQVKE